MQGKEKCLTETLYGTRTSGYELVLNAFRLGVRRSFLTEMRAVLVPPSTEKRRKIAHLV